MDKRQTLRVGIGFTTGRKSFRKVLKTYIYNWKECGLTDMEHMDLNLFIAYDLQYKNTLATDYTDINPKQLDLINRAYFIGKSAILNEVRDLIGQHVLSKSQAYSFFSRGYAAKRNIVLYAALKYKMDALIFLDDDEYPMAVTKTHDIAIWSGQDILATHLKHIGEADITNGYHCGYISPIPYIAFNQTLKEEDFRLFIEAISNDIINWNNIRTVMENGGVTYADTDVLIRNTAKEVPEINHTKFISGSNLCINLRKPERVLPFYNPPGARGEDTFLSTCLSKRKVLRLPCYTFHDGFSTYSHLTDGVLPLRLKPVRADDEQVVTRFYYACIGWIRYKPLYTYITRPGQYEPQMAAIRESLKRTLPKLCDYFERDDFKNISAELERYARNVKKHYAEFMETQEVWDNIRRHIT